MMFSMIGVHLEVIDSRPNRGLVFIRDRPVMADQQTHVWPHV